MLEITVDLVEKLIRGQFPEWTDLTIRPVEKSGHDNRTFHLGDEMSVRLPSAERYVAAVEKEITWLARLQPRLSLPIPSPVAKGEPDSCYPFPWSVNRWIDGDTASYERISDLNAFAGNLAGFLLELQAVDASEGPLAGEHNFYRGGDLAVYNSQTERALNELKVELPADKLAELWQRALSSKWNKKNVFAHGDVAVGNLLVQDGKLSGVIDFGTMGVGDPACDYVMAWTFFPKASRDIFFNKLGCDSGTIDRARGWALWKALITYHDTNADFAALAKFTINAILDETSV